MTDQPSQPWDDDRNPCVGSGQTGYLNRFYAVALCPFCYREIPLLTETAILPDHDMITLVR